MKDLFEQNFYELLEIEPHVPADQVRKAIDRARRVWADETGPSYSLLSAEERRHIVDRLAEAEEVLLDPLRRRQYDARHLSEAPGEGPQAVPPPVKPVPAARVQPVPQPEKPGKPRPNPIDYFRTEKDCTGENLRRFREAAGVSLAEIAEATKISRTHLENLEAGVYNLLPAPVYVRGFLNQYCRFLGLRASFVASGYLQLYELYRKMEQLP